MKICFFLSTLCPGGIERTASLLANIYSESGDEVSIITQDGEDSFYPLADKIKHSRMNLYGSSSNILQAIYMNLKRINALRHEFKKTKPDLVIAFASNTQLLAFVAKIGLRIKLVGAERANPFMSSASFWRIIKKWISCHCDGFLFQTFGAASYYPKKVQKKAIIVQNGIDAARFERFDRTWTQKKNICAVGRMDADKGFDDIIHTFALIHKHIPELVLDLYGDGPERTELENLARSLGLSSCIIFHGHCKEMYEEYSSHKYFLMMSKQEGFPNVLLEAMAAGCVCISGNCNFGPSELIRDGENGFLVSVGDYKSAAEKLLHLLNNEELGYCVSNKAKIVREINDIKQIALKIHLYLEHTMKGKYT